MLARKRGRRNTDVLVIRAVPYGRQFYDGQNGDSAPNVQYKQSKSRSAASTKTKAASPG